MLDADRAVAAVEISHLAGSDMGGADGEPRLAAVDQIKIDEFFKGLLQRRGRVIAGAFRPQHIGIAGMGKRIGPEESGNAVGDRRPIGKLLIEVRRTRYRNSRRGAAPFASRIRASAQPAVGLVACDQARIDRPDRSADDPVRLDAGFMQRLIDAGLVGAERTTALQHQDDLAWHALTNSLVTGRNGVFLHFQYPSQRCRPPSMYGSIWPAVCYAGAPL